MDVWAAANTGNLDELVVALSSQPHLIDAPNPDDPHEEGRTPMQIAAEKGHVGIIEKLVELGSEAVDTGRDGWTPMHAAALNAKVSVMETLVRLGSTAIDSLDANSWTPLFTAACKGHASVIETLVRLGSQAIDTPNESGSSPTRIAANCNQMESLKTLMSLGGDCSFEPTTLCMRRPTIELLRAGVDEDESREVRYRVYFQQSLVSRLLFEVQRNEAQNNKTKQQEAEQRV